MGQQRRRFSSEFKRDAVVLVKSSGRPIKVVAEELGIGESIASSADGGPLPTTGSDSGHLV